MTESYMVPEFDENGRFLSDKVNARIVDMIKANAPEQTSAGVEVITIAEGHPNYPETLVEPLPEDLPIGSYLVNDPPFMGYYLSQKTPMGWSPVYFEGYNTYNSYNTGRMDLRASVQKNSADMEDAALSATVSIKKDRVSFRVMLTNVSLAKDDRVKIILEGPSYPVINAFAVAQQFNIYNTDADAIVSHPVRVDPDGFYSNGEYVPGWTFNLRITKPLEILEFMVTFDLSSAPDLRRMDRMYVPPSERVEVTVPDPVFTMDDTYTASTLTIPEVEGVIWYSSHQGFEGIVEPGTYEIDGTVHDTVSVAVTPQKGYVLVNGENNGAGKWTWNKHWAFRHGIPITMPIPTPIRAATEDGVDGWIVRYPEVPNARYITRDGWYNPILKVMSGDMFTPSDTYISATSDPPYYVVKRIVGFLQGDGTIITNIDDEGAG